MDTWPTLQEDISRFGIDDSGNYPTKDTKKCDEDLVQKRNLKNI